MKNIGICYLLFIILLSIMPCADENGARPVDGQSITSAQHLDDFSADNCSPMCLCACCGQTLVTPAELAFAISTATTHHPSPTILQEDDLQKRSYSIWQPPKLG